MRLFDELFSILILAFFIEDALLGIGAAKLE